MLEAKFDILSELYKNYVIDVKAEQEKLVKADVIVLVYPFFWYGVPSLLQKWLEDCWFMAFHTAAREISYVAKSWCFHLPLVRLRSSIKKKLFSDMR